MTERARETAPSLFPFKSHPRMPIDTYMEKLSPQVRIFALVAALAAVGGMLFVFTAGRGAAAEPELAAPPAGRGGREAGEGCCRQDARSEGRRPAAAKAKAATAKAPAKRRSAEAVRSSADRLPRRGRQSARPPQGRRRLARRPGLTVDELAAGEAKAGAKLGGAGYLALNVLNERVAHALLAKLEGPKEPSVLVFKQSGEVALALEGFVDRETVAQAAANAAP